MPTLVMRVGSDSPREFPQCAGSASISLGRTRVKPRHQRTSTYGRLAWSTCIGVGLRVHSVAPRWTRCTPRCVDILGRFTVLRRGPSRTGRDQRVTELLHWFERLALARCADTALQHVR